MAKCTSCDSDIPDGIRFCPECGAGQPTDEPVTETKRFCSQCGAEVPLGADFCIQCGAEVASGGAERIRPDRPKAKARLKKVTPQTSQRRRNGAIAIAVIVPMIALLFWKLVSDSGTSVRPESISPMGATPSGVQNSEEQMQSIMQQIANLRQRIESDPDDLHAFLELGNIYGMVGMNEKAASQFEIYVLQHPENLTMRLMLAETYMKYEAVDKAVEQLDEVLKLEPENEMALYNYGIIKASQGDSTAARRAWETLIELNPESDAAASARSNLDNL